jgi:hypothetical protein
MTRNARILRLPALACLALALCLAALPACGRDSGSSAAPAESQESESASPETAADDADEVADGLTGWLRTTDAADTSGETYLTLASMSDGTLTLEGAFLSADSEDALSDAAAQSMSLTLAYDDATEWRSTGGEAGTTSISEAEFESLLEQQSGLGLTLEVEDGRVVSATISS